MKKVLLMATLIGVFAAKSNLAQEVSEAEVRANAEEYYYGEAAMENAREAEAKALFDLTRKIAVKVTNKYREKLTEVNGSVEENVEKVLNTYSMATLKNVKTIREKIGNKIRVFHYIKQSEVKKIFDERKRLIKNLFEKAGEYETKGFLGYALKNYYFAIILINSIPETSIYDGDKNLTVELPNKINDIISSIRFQLISDEMKGEKERELVFKLSAGETPVNQIEFSFWDGNNQIDVAAIDGEAILQLFGSSVSFDKLNVSIKYSFFESREEIKEVYELWDMVVHPPIKNTFTVFLNDTVEQEIAEEDNTGAYALSTLDPTADFKIRIKKSECPNEKKIGVKTLEFLDVIAKKDPQQIEKIYGGDPFLEKKIKNLIKYTNPVLYDNEYVLNINKTFEGWEVRKIKLTTNYSSISKRSNEYLILDFTDEGELYDLNFGVTNAQYKNFVNQAAFGKDWNNRQVIIKFIEKYRTSFLTRDIQMLDSLFADNAVIIVGRVLRRGKENEMYKYSKMNDSQPDVEYIKMSKEKYIQRQKEIFNSRRDLYLDFSTLDIFRKNKQKGVYGISMRQNYLSTNYSDEGYLFLLVDFYEEFPQIYVRSWQPKEWDQESLIKLSNFNINR